MSNNAEQKARVADAVAIEAITGMLVAMALDTPGVARLAERVDNRLDAKSGKAKNAKQYKSVRVVIKNDILSINMRIIASFGKPIPEIARRLQNEAKDRVREEFPHLTLAAVNVWIDGVSFE